MKRKDFLDVVFFFIALILLVSFSPSITNINFYLDDRDPSTYVGIVIFMLFIQLLFFPKPDLHPSKCPLNIVLGSIFLLSSILILMFLPEIFSLNFWYLRIDFLSMALFLMGSLIILFGVRALRSLKYTLLYAFLACTIFALPILYIQPTFTDTTSNAVHFFLRLIGMDIWRGEGNVFISPHAEQPIIIAPACTALTALLGLAVFLLPFLYFFKGKVTDKAKWFLSGIILMLMLNFLRIFLIVFVWYNFGLGDAIKVFHSSSGVVLFNIALIAMFISFPKFGLSIDGVGWSWFVRKGLGGLRKSLLSMEKHIIAKLIGLFLMAILLFYLDSMVYNYTWLNEFRGDFSTFLVYPTDLAIPDGWEFLTFEGSYSTELSISKHIFTYEGKQIQLLVLSSKDRNLLWFDPVPELKREGFIIETTKKIYLGKGIYGSLIEYRKDEDYYTSLSWSSPLAIDGGYTYGAFALTIADSSKHKMKGKLEEWARELTDINVFRKRDTFQRPP